MRTIDGIRYISAREYAEMMDLTVGRVSQLKASLPFVKFEEFGIEVINFDLLSLSKVEKALAQGKFETPTPIHTLSYKDLGAYFGKLVMDLVNFKGSADMQIEGLQNKANDLRQQGEQLAKEKADLSAELREVISAKEALALTLADEVLTNENLVKEQQQTGEILADLQEQYAHVVREHIELKIINNDTKHGFEIKVIENKNLLAENENAKTTFASALADKVLMNENLTKEHQQTKGILADLQEQYANILREYGELRMTNSDTKHAFEIKAIENKNLLAENEGLKTQLASLVLSAKTDTDFKKEFKDLKALVMKKISNEAVK